MFDLLLYQCADEVRGCELETRWVCLGDIGFSSARLTAVDLF